MKEININFSQLLIIGILLVIPPLLPYASAEVTVDWTVSGIPVLGMGVSEGNLDSGFPVSIMVSDTDTIFNVSAVDTIDVLIASTEEPAGTTLTLTETGVNTNNFFGDTLSYDGNFVFIPNSSHRFSISDTVVVQVTEDPTTLCDSDDTITELDSVNDFEGVFVYSDTEVENGAFGIGLILTETGPNTCIFEETLSFTDIGPSDEDTGTLHVSVGDIITFLDDVTTNVVNAQITTTVDGKGSIVVDYDNLFVNNEVTATYLGVSANLDVTDDGLPGRGGGGVVRPIIVVDSSNDSSSDSSNGSGCSGDCSPPTLGVDSSFNRLVSDGFSYNENPVDVGHYYTPYPLVTVQVGAPNRAILKIYDDGGTQNIAHVELGFGLGKGESFSENRAAIILDMSRDGRQSVTTFDPENVLDDVSVVTRKDSCGNLTTQCLVVIIDHTFRESLEFNMVGTQVWDFKKNSWQNFYNHGVHIIGDSLNPTKTKTVAFGTKEMRGLFTLTQIHKINDTWIDEFGNVYQNKGNDRFDIIQTIPRQVIEEFFTMHGCDRNCNWFEKYKQNQEMIAQSKLETILGGNITKDLPSFNPSPKLYIVSRADDVLLQKSISLEIQRAQEIFVNEYYVKQNIEFYPLIDKDISFMAFQNQKIIDINK